VIEQPARHSARREGGKGFPLVGNKGFELRKEGGREGGREGTYHLVANPLNRTDVI